jgi:non-ribosomal peptide synthetase component F
VLYREITTLYEAYRLGLPNPLQPLRIQYKDFAEWQNAQSFESDEQYWCAKLSGTPEMIRLPYDLPLQKERDFRGSHESIVIGFDTLEGLREQALVASTSLPNVVLALFKLLLFHWTRQDDICVGVSIANRSHPDLENLLGFFVNVLPIRTQLSAESEFANLLDQVTRNTSEAFEHQNYPFDLMVQKLRPQRVANRQPLVNVLYGFQNFEDINIELDQFDRGTPPLMQGDSSSLVEVLPFEVSFDISKFDLTLFVSEQEDHLIVSLEYDTGLFLPKTIKRLTRTFERFAQTVARDSKPAEVAK